MGNGGLHGGDLRFDRLEAAGQVFGDGAGMKGGQDFGARKIGQITGPGGRAGFFQAAIFVLGDAKDDNAVAGFSRHKNQAVRYKRALSACVAPWTARGGRRSLGLMAAQRRRRSLAVAVGSVKSRPADPGCATQSACTPSG